MISENHFAWLRTRWSLEQIMMAWVRTAISLIGFGFTIVLFFEHLQSTPGVDAAVSPTTPRAFGLALIFAGVAALLISLWQYRTLVRYLWSGEFSKLAGFDEHAHQTPLLALTLLLLVVGTSAFVGLLFRLI
jgi:putative membrane protein